VKNSRIGKAAFHQPPSANAISHRRSTMRLCSRLVDAFLVVMTFQGSCDSAFCSGALSTKMAGLTRCHTTGILVSLALFLMFTPCQYFSGWTGVSVGFRLIDERFTAEYLSARSSLLMSFYEVTHVTSDASLMAFAEIISRSILSVGNHGFESLVRIFLMLIDQVHQRRVFLDVT
jgi:hypothetical protein